MFQEKKLSMTQCQKESKITFYAFDKASEDLIEEYSSNIIDQYERNKYFEDMNYEHNVSSNLKQYLNTNHLKLCGIKSNNERILFVFNKNHESILLLCKSSEKLSTNSTHDRYKRQSLFEQLLFKNNQINQRLINFVSESNASIKQDTVNEEKKIIDGNVDNSLVKQKLSPTDVMLQEIAESLYHLSQNESDTDHLKLIKNRCTKLIYKYHFIQFTVNKKELKLIIFKDQNNSSNKICTFDVKHANIEKYKTILQSVSNAIYVSSTEEGYIKGMLFFKTSFVENELIKDLYTNELQRCSRQEQALCYQLLKNSEKYEIIYEYLLHLVDQSIKTDKLHIFNEQIISLTLAIIHTEFIKPLVEKIIFIDNNYGLFQQMYLNHGLQTNLLNHLLSVPDEKILHFLKTELSPTYITLLSKIIEQKKQLIQLIINNSAGFNLESLIKIFESNVSAEVKALMGIMIIQNDNTLKESTLDQLKEIYPNIKNQKELIDLISINNEFKNIFSTFENDHREKSESQKLVIRTKTSSKKKSSPPRQMTKTFDDVIASYGRWGLLATHILSMDVNDIHTKTTNIKTKYLIPYVNKNPKKIFVSVGDSLPDNILENFDELYSKLYDMQNENFFFKTFYRNFESEKLTPYEFIDIFAYIFDEKSSFKLLKLYNLKFWESFFSKLMEFVPENDKRKLLLKFNDDEINFIRDICKYNKNLRNLYSELFDVEYDFSSIFINELKLITLAFIPKVEFIQCNHFLSTIFNNYIESDEYQKITGDEFNQNDFYTKDILDLAFSKESMKTDKYSKHKLLIFFNSRFISNLIYPPFIINLELDRTYYFMIKSYILNIIWFGISRLNTDDQNNTLEIPYLNITFESDVVIPKDNTEKYISDLIRLIVGFSLLNLKFNCELIKFSLHQTLQGYKALKVFKNYSTETKVIFEKALGLFEDFEKWRQIYINNGTKLNFYGDLSELKTSNNEKNNVNAKIDYSTYRWLINKESIFNKIASSINFNAIVRNLLSIHPSKRKMVLFNVMNEYEFLSFESFASVFSDLEKNVKKEESEGIFEDINSKFFSCTIKKQGMSITNNDASFFNHNNVIVEEKNFGAVLNEHYPNFYSERFF